MASKAIYIVVAVVGIAAASGAAWWYQNKPAAGADGAGPGATSRRRRRGAGARRRRRPAARPWKWRGSRCSRLTDDAQAVGSLRSRQSVMLRPEVSGRVTQLNFRDGDRVRKGQLLVQLDDQLPLAQVQQAQAELSIAQANHKRNQELVAQNFISQRSVDESAANLQVAQAKLALARATAARLRIVAPFDGMAGIRSINVGDYLKDGADIVNIEDIEAMFVDFRLPERFQTKVRAARRRSGRPRRAARPQIQRAWCRRSTRWWTPTAARSACAAASTTGRCSCAPACSRASPRCSASATTRASIPEEAIVPQGGRQFVIRLVDGPDRRHARSPSASRSRSACAGRAASRSSRACRPATWWSRPASSGCRRTARRCAWSSSSARPAVRSRCAGGGGRPCRRARQPGRGGAGRAAAARQRRACAGRGSRRARRLRPPAPIRAMTATSAPAPAAGPAGARAVLTRRGAHPCNCAEISIRRPVFATVLSLLVLLVGAVSFNRLSVREYPEDRRAGGHGERALSRRLGRGHRERRSPSRWRTRIAGIEGVDVITSISRAEQSQITVRFRLEKTPTPPPPTCATASRVRNRLPQAIDEPVIAKVEADAFPVIWLAFSSDTLTPLEITDLRQPHRQAAPADPARRGRRAHLRRAQVRHARLARPGQAGRLPPDAAGRRGGAAPQNLEMPAGRIESAAARVQRHCRRPTCVRPAQFGEIVIKQRQRLSGAACATWRACEEAAGRRAQRRVRLNGRPAISVGVISQATANPLDAVAGRARDAARAASRTCRRTCSIDIANDNSVFIDRSIKNVYRTIVEAIVLVALVIFVFLRTVRATHDPAS